MTQRVDQDSQPALSFTTEAALEPSHATDVLIDVSDDQTGRGELILPAERLKLVYGRFGFLPVNRRELNEAFNLALFYDEFGTSGTARHLNEVLIHQRRLLLQGGERGGEKPEDTNGVLVDSSAKDPGAAVRSIVGQYGFFARRSRHDIVQLRTLQDQLGSAIRLRPDMTLGAFVAEEEMALSNGPAQLVRHADLLRIQDDVDIDTNGVNSLLARGKGNVDEYTRADRTDEFTGRILTKLGDISAVRTRDSRVISKAIETLARRDEFWTERLKEAYGHLSARVVVRRLLNQRQLDDADNILDEMSDADQF